MSAGVVVLLAGCATQINSPTQSITVSSEPPNADVWIDQRFHVTTPATVQLNRKGPHTAVFKKAGYETATVTIERRASSWIWLDITCLPAVVYCVSKDTEAGGYYTFDDELKATLQPKAGTTPPSDSPS